MVTKAENIAADEAPFSRVRVHKITEETTELNEATLERVRSWPG